MSSSDTSSSLGGFTVEAWCKFFPPIGTLSKKCYAYVHLPQNVPLCYTSISSGSSNSESDISDPSSESSKSSSSANFFFRPPPWKKGTWPLFHIRYNLLLAGFYVSLCYTLPKESPFFVDWAFTKWLRFTNIKTFRDKELRTELKCSTQRKTPQKEIQSRIPQWLQLHILKHIKWNGGLFKRVTVTVENRTAARKENANKSMFISTLEFN